MKRKMIKMGGRHWQRPVTNHLQPDSYVGEISLSLTLAPGVTEQVKAFNAKVEVLLDILGDLDEYDRPKVKLPDCPRCGEDELGVIHSDLLMCYKCRWEIQGRLS